MDPFVRGMALVRFLSATAELAGALLMIRANRLEDAFRINAALGLVGPLVLMLTATIGVMGLAGKLSLAKIAMIFAGVCLIFLGTR